MRRAVRPPASSGEEGVTFTEDVRREPPEPAALPGQSPPHRRSVLRAPGSGRIITSWQGHRPDLITRYLTDDEVPFGGDAA